MGTNVAPAYANLFMAFHELKWMQELGIRFPRLYFRFIDDMFFVWEESPDKLRQFIDRMNSSTLSLKFTFEINEDQAIFLDLILKKSDLFASSRTLDISPYEKPTNKHLYLSPDTFHPDNQKYSWITGENIRLLRNSSREDYFSEALQQFKYHLTRRGYPADVIERYIKYEFSQRPRFLFPLVKKLGKPPFIIGVPNEPGRDLVVKQLRRVLEYVKIVYQCDLPDFYLVVYAGRTLLDTVRSTNREVLSPSRVVLVDDHPANAPEDTPSLVEVTTSQIETDIKLAEEVTDEQHTCPKRARLE